jgi:hypothetical protein
VLSLVRLVLPWIPLEFQSHALHCTYTVSAWQAVTLEVCEPPTPALSSATWGRMYKASWLTKRSSGPAARRAIGLRIVDVDYYPVRAQCDFNR